MIYTGLSRVQSLNQLYIIDKIPFEKIAPWPDALEEIRRLENLDLSTPTVLPQNEFEIVSLNTISLISHINDINADTHLICANVLLIQETSIPCDFDIGMNFSVTGKMVHFTGRGHRNGLATYFPPGFMVTRESNHNSFQLCSISSEKFSITNVYRSKHAGNSFLTELTSHIDDDSTKIQVLMGDFNYCQRDECDHPVKKYLEENNFILGFNPPQPTHIKGRCLDQIFVRMPNGTHNIVTSGKVCLYSDHDSISVKWKLN